MKIEIWNGYEIRFVKKDGEWWAVAKDVADALDYRDAHNMVRNIEPKDKDTHKVSTPGGLQNLLVISEFGIYDAVFTSHKPEAKEFKRWVYGVLKQLRRSSGLAGSMFPVKKRLGDNEGHYIGTTGIMRKMVFLTLERACRLNQSSSAAFLGTLGGGEVF